MSEKEYSLRHSPSPDCSCSFCRDYYALDEAKITYLGDVQRLKLCPDDVIVISIHHPISEDTAQRLSAHVKKHFPNNQVLVLADGIKILVLAKSEALS